MSATILDGKALARSLTGELKAELVSLKTLTGTVPRLVTIVVGEDASAASYGKSQQRAAEAIGIDHQCACLPPQVTLTELLDQVRFLNDDPAVHGIMVHKPLPDGIVFQEIANAIAPAKDVEGMGEANLGKLFLGRTEIIPATPAAALALLVASGVTLAGKDALIIGRSEIVGKPLIHLLLGKDLTVTTGHSATSRAGRLMEHIGRADVVIAAMGKAGFVKGDWIKEGAIVIDVGINEAGGKITGDVEFETARARASFITPVPGGVGPVTAVMLMKNAITAFKYQLGKA